MGFEGFYTRFCDRKSCIEQWMGVCVVHHHCAHFNRKYWWMLALFLLSFKNYKLQQSITIFRFFARSSLFVAKNEFLAPFVLENERTTARTFARIDEWIIFVSSSPTNRIATANALVQINDLTNCIFKVPIADSVALIPGSDRDTHEIAEQFAQTDETIDFIE